MSQTMRVSLPGYNALTDGTITHYSLYADSDNVLLKQRSSGAGTAVGTVTVTHNSGYIPFYISYGEITTNRFRMVSGYDFISGQWRSSTGTATLNIVPGVATGTATRQYKYYVFYDDIN